MKNVPPSAATTTQVAVFDQLKAGLPDLINRIVKAKRDLLVAAVLFEGLSSEQQEEVLSLLNPEQLSVLCEQLSSHEERVLKLPGTAEASP